MPANWHAACKWQRMDIRLIEPLGLGVLIADADPQSAAMLGKMLSIQGYKISGVVAEPADFAARCAELCPDVIVINAGAFERQYLAALDALPSEDRRPTVMLSAGGAPEDIKDAVAAGVSAYVLVGVNGNRIRAGIDLAIANFSNVAVLRQELDQARAALEARKLVERAKGIIMRQKRLDEDAAYRLLRGRAMERGVRLVEIARLITEAEDLLA